MTDEERAAISRLIGKLNQRVPPNSSERKARQQAKFSKIREAPRGQELGKILNYPKVYQDALQHGEIASSLKPTQNDPLAICQMFDAFFELEDMYGEVVPPFWMKRLAIYLRKQKQTDLEIDALRAWLRLYPNGNGAAFRELAERRRKLEPTVPPPLPASIEANHPFK